MIQVDRDSADRAATVGPAWRMPAEPGLWAFVLADTMVFAGFFGFYFWCLGDDRGGSAAQASNLIVPLGILNTLVLLGSSWAALRAVHSHRAEAYGSARKWLRYTLTGVAVFVIVKLHGTTR